MTNSIGTISNVPGYSGITFNIGSYITENGNQVNINACYNEPFEMTKGGFTYYRSAVWREIYNDEIWYDVFCPVSVENARLQAYDIGGGRIVNGEENDGEYGDNVFFKSNPISGTLPGSVFNITINLNALSIDDEDISFNIPVFNSEQEFVDYITTPDTQYQWSSVPAISGKNGILSLTMIKDDKIEEGTTTHQVLPEDNIERYTAQSNMRLICLNHLVNEWFIAAESGLNQLQLRYNYGGTDNDILVIEFKIRNHYGEGNNQYYADVYSGQIYQPPSLDGERDAYLAFIIDEENEVAQFDPVTHYRVAEYTPPLFGVDYGYLQPNDQQMAAMYYFLKGSPEEIDEDDPYADGIEGDGGDGNPYQPQDHLGLSSKPTKSGLNLGIVTLYNPDESELAAIAQFLWSDDTLENFKKYFNNFADNLMGLYVLPVTPDAASKASKVFKVGNLTSEDASLQSVDYITDRYADIDMGSFYIKRKYDSYLDVSPYTKLEIYLPYCGTHQLNTDEIMYPANSEGYLPVESASDIELKLNYRVDLVTGNIVATLFVNGENRYQFTGKCGMSVPLTGANYNNMIQGAITAGAGLAATIATGGLTAPLSVSAAVSGTVMAQKPEVYRSGNLSGDVSMLGYDTPYLIKTIPSKPKLDKQEIYTGYPSYKKDLLSSFSGYTEVIEAHIDDVSCTSAEKDRIMAALKGGVIL